MTIRHALERCRAHSGKKWVEVAAELGVSRQCVDSTLSRSTLSANAMEVLRVLGYRVVLVPVGTEAPEGSVEL